MALDDMDLTFPHGAAVGAFFVHCDASRGLTPENATAALACLGRRLDRSTLPAAVTREETKW